MDADEAALERADAEGLVKEAKDAIVAFKKLYHDVEKGKANIDNRVIGHVRFSPSIKYGAGSNRYTRDYALVGTNRSKMDTANFTGNIIDLGTQIAFDEFTRLMFPNPKNRHTVNYSGKNQECTQGVFDTFFPGVMSYETPTNRLFKVQGIVPDEEMRFPAMLDQNDDPCFIIMKRGNTTGLTIGCANNILSYVRNDNGDTQTSKEWAILPL